MVRPRQIALCCIVVILLTGTSVPARVLASEDRSVVTAEQGARPVQSIGARDLTPLAAKRSAIAILESMSRERINGQPAMRRSIALINGTLSAYRDDTRVSSGRVFSADRLALTHIDSLRRVNRTKVDVVTSLLVTADLETANTSIYDALRARRLVGARIESAWVRHAVDRFIHRSNRSLQLAMREFRVRGRGHSIARRQAILARTRSSWSSSQRAVDLLAMNSQPSITIDTRRDPPGRAGSLGNRTIRGTITAVRSYELPAVTVTVNGVAMATVPIEATTAPGRNATYEANVRLSAPTALITVRIANGRSKARRRPRGNGWLREVGPAGRGVLLRHRAGRNLRIARATAATIRFDGDGLPGIYERDVVGTDPLSADSDTPHTVHNDAGNDLIDGAEDFDEDGLTTYDEYRYGTDPFARDTDGDGLPDRFETSIPGHFDPTMVDSDGNGVTDGAEDFDHDGLTSIQEYRNGTSVSSTDTDHDGLSDLEEGSYRTAPNNPDTDSDGLEDGAELALGVDPTNPDTDDDGTVDGMETYTSRVTDQSTGVGVRVTGVGDAGAGLEIKKVSTLRTSVGGLSPVVRIRNQTGFDSAILSMPIPPRADNATIITWHPGSDEPWHAIETRVNASTRYASASTGSFSYFAVVDRSVWNRSRKAVVPVEWPQYESFTDLNGWSIDGTAEVVSNRLVVSGPDHPSLARAPDDNNRPPHRDRLVSLADPLKLDPRCLQVECSATTLRLASSDPATAELELSRRSASGPRLATPVSYFESVVSRPLVLGSQGASVHIAASIGGTSTAGWPPSILVTDGDQYTTIGQVSESDDSFRVVSGDVSQFAGGTVDVLLIAPAYSTLEVDWIDVRVDSDNDGIRDLAETAGPPLLVGVNPGKSLTALDPKNPDSDGDGIPDGEELTSVVTTPYVRGDSTYLRFRVVDAISDPTAKNSDGVGLDDAAEIEAGSDPLVPESVIAGFTLPTMTMGPQNTLDDRKPMTVAQAHGRLIGGGSDASLITWASRQYFDRTLCIKELTKGPGCSGEWMSGVTPRDNYQYLYIPFVVYFESNVETRMVDYKLTVKPAYTSRLVKAINTTGRIDTTTVREGYLVIELPEIRTYQESQPGIFRPIGEIDLSMDLSDSKFGGGKERTIGRRYAVSTDTLLPATDQMLEDTKFVLEHGVNIALAAESGVSVAVETGSRTNGAVVFLYELAKDQIDTPPVSLSDLAMEASLEGIGTFEEHVTQARSKVYTDIFGEGIVRSTGPTIILEN